MSNFVDYSNAQAIMNRIAQKFNAVNGAYIFRGSIPFASLPATLTSDMAGYTYNITNDFTTDARFIEGSGFSYKAGTNVSVADLSTYAEATPAGSENPSTEGWYELINGKYVLSTDTEVVVSKTYYIKTTSVKFDINGAFFDIDEIDNKIDAVEDMIAPEFDPTQPYVVGDVVIYLNKLYKFKSPHTANDPWDPTEVDEVAVTDLVGGGSGGDPDALTAEQVAALIALLG